MKFLISIFLLTFICIQTSSGGLLDGTPKGIQSLTLDPMPNGWTQKTQTLMIANSEEIFKWAVKDFVKEEIAEGEQLSVQVDKLEYALRNKITDVVREMGDAIDQLYRFHHDI
jgi:GH43 family beta-xylosidase